MATVKRVMSKRIDLYDRIVIEYTEFRGVVGMRKLRTFQAYGSSGGTVWNDFNTGGRLPSSLEGQFCEDSKMAERLLKQFQVPYGTWLDLDERSMSSLLKNDINHADVFKVMKVEK